MNYLKRNIKSTLLILLGLFVLLAVYFYYNLFLYSERWFSNPNNTRIRVDMTNPSIIPGSITDRNGKIMVETKSTKNNNGTLTYYRKYSKDSRYAAHVIGSKKYGIGAEALYIRYLLGYDNNLLERIYQKAFIDQEVGNDVILTIDIRLQKFISQAMGKSKGSVVLMNPSTGEILAMVSMPSFNPTDDDEEPADESLLNKASYGKYTPGSIMKVITAAAALESMENPEDFIIECKGSTDINGITINCSGNEAHGKVDLARAMMVSCNAYFAKLTQEIGWKQFRKTAEKFGFNKDFLFSDIKTAKSDFPINNKTDVEELAWSGIGQGKVLVTPLHMALIASSIANDGIMPEPKLIYGIKTRTDRVKLHGHNKLAVPLTEDISQKLTNMMISVVENGTGRNARTKGMLIAGKTGTAEVGSDKNPHAWFIGFAPADEPTLVISVILENTGSGGSKAAPLAGKILREAARLGY